MARILVEDGEFAAVIGHVEVEPAVVVEVAAIDRHARVRVTEVVVGRPHGRGNFFESPEAVIAKKEIRNESLQTKMSVSPSSS